MIEINRNFTYMITLQNIYYNRKKREFPLALFGSKKFIS